MATVLPKELRLAAPPTMPQARTYMFKQQAAQTEAVRCGETFQINIPRLQRSYLTKDSYLKFTVDMSMKPGLDGTDPVYKAYWEKIGVLGLIDRIEVYDYLGSTLLESISGHGQLMGLLYDLSQTIGESETSNSVTLGTYNYYRGQAICDVTPALATDVITNSREYAFPLFSFLGLLSEKFAPLHNGYTIQITLNPQNIACAVGDYSGANIPVQGDGHELSISIRDIYYCCQVLELGPEAESLILSSAGPNPLIVPTKSYRNYVGLVKAAAPTFRLDLNLNVASLTNVMWIMRNADYASPHFKSLTHRVRNYLQSWYFQYGSSILPQTQGIQCRSKNTAKRLQTLNADAATAGNCDHSEAYLELIKARHKFNVPNHWNQITLNHFIHDKDSTTTNPPKQPAILYPGNDSQGMFAAGLDLELVSGRSNELISGMNTNGMNTSIFANFDPIMYANIAEVRVDAWCEYDSFINIAPGIATTVSF